MSDDFEIRIPIDIDIPRDSDGFVRRECPNCEQQFKWFAHEEGDRDAEQVSQYFCPLCGQPSGVDSWWTQEQVEHGRGLAGPDMDRAVKDALAKELKGIKGLTFKPDPNFSLEIEPPEPLHEPDDMVIAEPPCHPNEPVKVPEGSLAWVHCLICGSEFAV